MTRELDDITRYLQLNQDTLGFARYRQALYWVSELMLVAEDLKERTDDT